MVIKKITIYCLKTKTSLKKKESKINTQEIRKEDRDDKKPREHTTRQNGKYKMRLFGGGDDWSKEFRSRLTIRIKRKMTNQFFSQQTKEDKKKRNEEKEQTRLEKSR